MSDADEPPEMVRVSEATGRDLHELKEDMGLKSYDAAIREFINRARRAPRPEEQRA